MTGYEGLTEYQDLVMFSLSYHYGNKNKSKDINGNIIPQLCIINNRNFSEFAPLCKSNRRIDILANIVIDGLGLALLREYPIVVRASMFEVRDVIGEDYNTFADWEFLSCLVIATASYSANASTLSSILKDAYFMEVVWKALDTQINILPYGHPMKNYMYGRCANEYIRTMSTTSSRILQDIKTRRVPRGIEHSTNRCIYITA